MIKKKKHEYIFLDKPGKCSSKRDHNNCLCMGGQAPSVKAVNTEMRDSHDTIQSSTLL